MVDDGSDEEYCADNEPQKNDEVVLRTPFPSDVEHAKILMGRNFRKDRKGIKLYAARLLALPFLFIMWTVSIYTNYDEFVPDAPAEKNLSPDGKYELFPTEAFNGSSSYFPSKYRIGGGVDVGFLKNITKNIELLFNDKNSTAAAEVLESMNTTDLEDTCDDIPVSASDGVCVYFHTTSNYTIFFGGVNDPGEWNFSAPTQKGLVGAQWTINRAILGVNNEDETYVPDIKNIQLTPRRLSEEQADEPTYFIAFALYPGMMHVLSSCFMLAFLIAPISYEKINGISRSFLLVGVRKSTYLLQWVLYHSLNSIVISGVMTIISVYWKVMPMSNAGLIFVSHYLGLVQCNVLYVLIMQFIEQEEFAQGVPWLMAIAMGGISAAVTLTTESFSSVLLSVLTVFHPIFGMVQYYGIYVTYDVYGYNTGVHPGDNVGESGLLGNMIAQLVGILFWTGMILLYSSPNIFSKQPEETDDTVPGIEDENPDKFEELSPNADVLISVRGLCHTYYPTLKQKLCNRKDAKPAEVLKGLNLDICRGEVFGYLGHNGAGKTTSINILSSDQVTLQRGNVTYRFRDGHASLSDNQQLSQIRGKIGVCPQHNTALQDDLSPREILRLFAHLKGRIRMSSSSQTVREAVEAEVASRLEDVKFTSDEDADKPIGTFSGGMKRKVLIAMALLGDPEVVFLDEPTAGLDPYNRRTIWDMINAAKPGRSIILTTHFVDEADILSDRIGIIKNGKLITCGSSLFLKHQSQVGYTLGYDETEDGKKFDVASVISSAEEVVVENEASTTKRWRLKHGSESLFPKLFAALREAGATRVSLDLTSLEQVFLESGKEDENDTTTNDSGEDDESDNNDEENQLETGDKFEYLKDIWKKPSNDSIQIPGYWQKIMIVMKFMMKNSMRNGDAVFMNIVMPLGYLVGAVVITKLMEPQEAGILQTSEPITIGNTFFGAPQKFFYDNSSAPATFASSDVTLIGVPESLDVYNDPTLVGGFNETDSTLQYNDDSPYSFALQFCVGILSNILYDSDGTDGTGVVDGISTSVQQLPYLSSGETFRIEMLLFPMFVSFGFVGTVFAVIDVLLLRGDNALALFRVAGISEWMTNVGIVMYKAITTFVPFFLLLIILGFSLEMSYMGNGGRWLGSILILLAYLYSQGPIGLLLGKCAFSVKTKGEVKQVANWFPGVYMTLISIPYTAWSILAQVLPQHRELIDIGGDVLCVLPPFAFQRGFGGLLEVSGKYNDSNIGWDDVWSWAPRVWFTILMMIVIGSLEWYFLYRVTSARAQKTKLTKEEEEVDGYSKPVDVSKDVDISAERDRSLMDDDGINARDLVKVFRVKASDKKNSGQKIIKRSVKGVSYGIRRNQIFALLGPNGAGKTVTMSMLAGEYTPEHGAIALDGKKMTDDDGNIDDLYRSCTVAYCPQFDALFEKLTVEAHLQFYSSVRGLDWKSEATQKHINAIIRLLGLEKYRHKESSNLSGGYKRRLSLAVAMIGYPKVMMVDEITTGLDPGARRLIWDVLKPPISHEGEYDIPAILLSSHYMDECQELGTRIGIMIDGEVSTTGSLERLQERFCDSYFVELSMQPTVDDTTNNEDAVLAAFEQHNMPDTTVYESLPYHLKLQVPFVTKPMVGTEQLSSIFELLESNKDSLGIKFYSVSMMNLEQIFIDLSRKQFQANETFEFERSMRAQSARSFGSLRGLSSS